MANSRIRTQDQILVDTLHQSPVDAQQGRFRRWVFWAVVLIIVLLLLQCGLRRVFADRPVDYSAIEQHFKYGSIGSELGGTIFTPVGGMLPPYWLFRILPDICPDKLPGGYAAVGLLFEAGHDLPIGVSRRRRLGVEQVGLNCAVCHVGTYRTSPQDEPHIVLGMPAHGLDLQRFFAFILSCVQDARFTADNVIAQVQRSGGKLGLVQRLFYRWLLVPRVRQATQAQQQDIGLLLGQSVPAWGRGRVDTFNPYKVLQFRWPLEKLPRSELIGASDFPSLWNQEPRARAKMHLHWDGNNDSVDERNLSAALGAGVTPVTIDHARLQRIREWIWTLPPPPYPEAFPIDTALAARGEQLYAHHCVACHADHRFRDGVIIGAEVGQVVPITTIKTDPYRFTSYTYTFAANQYTLYPDSRYHFAHFRKTTGYANHPLDGIWARAPYLHNGSLPTLRDVLEPPEKRPQVFYRGYDVFDPVKVGFIADPPAALRDTLFKFDTRIPGNENGGHLYGTMLSPED